MSLLKTLNYNLTTTYPDNRKFTAISLPDNIVTGSSLVKVIDAVSNKFKNYTPITGIPTKVSELENDNNFATINNVIANWNKEIIEMDTKDDSIDALCSFVLSNLGGLKNGYYPVNIFALRWINRENIEYPNHVVSLEIAENGLVVFGTYLELTYDWLIFKLHNDNANGLAGIDASITEGGAFEIAFPRYIPTKMSELKDYDDFINVEIDDSILHKLVYAPNPVIEYIYKSTTLTPIDIGKKINNPGIQNYYTGVDIEHLHYNEEPDGKFSALLDANGGETLLISKVLDSHINVIIDGGGLLVEYVKKGTRYLIYDTDKTVHKYYYGTYNTPISLYKEGYDIMNICSAEIIIDDDGVEVDKSISNFLNPTVTLLPINDSGYATTSDVDKAIADLVDSAPDTLNTLKELSNALGNDADFATTVTNSIASKLDSSAVSDWALAESKPSYNYSEINDTPDLTEYVKTSDLTYLSDSEVSSYLTSVFG